MKPDKILYGKDEFYSNINNKIYEIYKIDNLKKEKYMKNIFKKCIKNINVNKTEIQNSSDSELIIDKKSKDFLPTEQYYLGIDFEFNKVSKNNRDVALMQINLENNSNIGYIFIFDPSKLKSKIKKYLIKILIFSSIIKILHGSESLDIPYLFNQLLIDPDLINEFCKNYYDTKFICDYINISGNLVKPKSCSIYDFLLDNNIINQEQIDNLDKIEESMGPIYLIHIDINEMDDNLFNYTLYDVIFLPQLIKKFINSNNNYIIISELFR